MTRNLRLYVDLQGRFKPPRRNLLYDADDDDVLRAYQASFKPPRRNLLYDTKLMEQAAAGGKFQTAEAEPPL